MKSDAFVSEPTPGLIRSVSVPGFSLRRYSFTPGHRIGRHEHQAPVLVWTLRGGYRATMRRENYVSGFDEMWMVPPALSHREEVGPVGSDALLIFPTTGGGGEDHRIFKRLQRFPVGGFRSLARRLLCAFHALDSAAPLLLESALLELTRELMQSQPTASRHERRWLNAAREYLDANLMASCTLEEVARVVGVHRSHLGRSFRHQFGCSPGDYVRSRRLERAAHQLISTDEPLSGIAGAAGFYDQSHFTNSFRLQFGMTPARYRKGGRRPD